VLMLSYSPSSSMLRAESVFVLSALAKLSSLGWNWLIVRGKLRARAALVEGKIIPNRENGIYAYVIGPFFL
jgi:hypothetical protein